MPPVILGKGSAGSGVGPTSPSAKRRSARRGLSGQGETAESPARTQTFIPLPIACLDTEATSKVRQAVHDTRFFLN
jgi:hypothetical protein